MPILAAAAATAAAVSYTTPLLITGATAITGFLGGLFWRLRSRAQSQTSSKQLEALQEASIKRASERDEAIERLALSAASEINRTASSSTQLSSRLHRTADDLSSETQSIQEANQRLQEAVSLLQEASLFMGDEAKPLLLALQKRLSGVARTHEALIVECDTLKQTVQQLQETVQKHQTTQKRLESVSTTHGEASPLRVENKRLRRQVSQLKEKLTSSARFMAQQTQTIRSLRVEHKALETALGASSSHTTEEKPPQSSPRSFRLFH